MSLTDAQLRALKPQERTCKVSDGGGLYIHITPSGSKLWRMAYRIDGKQKTLSFGPYPATSLALARQRRDEAKARIARGVDPSLFAKTTKAARRYSAGNTFSAIADELLAKAEREGLADITVRKKRWLLAFVRPAIGARPIKEIGAADVLAPLKELEAGGKFETARRVRGIVGQVFRYAIATARADIDPTYGLRGALITPQVTHHAAIIDREAFAALVRAIWTYDGSPETTAALKLLALLYPRPGELRRARWTEFNLAKRDWKIPAERMKMRREHRKPLSRAAIDTLNDLHSITGSGEMVFPSPLAPGRTISENTLNAALRRLGYAKGVATAHGFRSSASSLLNESGLWSPDAIEAELAHADRDAVRRAYHRAAYWDERVKMCDWWADQILEMLAPTSCT